MDYQGNYFPDEHDENESKIYRTVKGIFKWTMYGISFVLYAIVIFLMITNRDRKILERNYMLQNTDIETQDVLMYKINTRIFMNDDGSLTVYNVDYAPEHKLVEIGIKYNAKKLTNGDYGDCLDYILEDSNGNKYKLVNKELDNGGRYGFSRICFEGLDIDLSSNDLRFNEYLYGSVRPAISKSDVFLNRTDISYSLSVVRKTDGELLYKFNLYDNSTTFSTTEYDE